jgi:lysozyme
MSVSNETFDLAKRLEGLPGGKPALVPYKDQYGTWTNGYGNTHGVMADTPAIPPERAEFDLRPNLSEADAAVGKLVKVPLSNNQRGALTLFVLNEGEEALRTSKLLRLLNAGNYTGALAQFDRWVYGHNPKTHAAEISNGLVARRAAEKTLWLTPDPADAEPPHERTGPAVTPPQPKTALGTSTGKAQAAIIVTGGMAAVVQGVQQAQQISDAAHAAVTLTAGWPQWAVLIVGALIFSCIGFAFWTLIDKQRKVED